MTQTPANCLLKKTTMILAIARWSSYITNLKVIVPTRREDLKIPSKQHPPTIQFARSSQHGSNTSAGPPSRHSRVVLCLHRQGTTRDCRAVHHRRTSFPRNDFMHDWRCQWSWWWSPAPPTSSAQTNESEACSSVSGEERFFRAAHDSSKRWRSCVPAPASLEVQGAWKSCGGGATYYGGVVCSAQKRSRTRGPGRVEEAAGGCSGGPPKRAFRRLAETRR